MGSRCVYCTAGASVARRAEALVAARSTGERGAWVVAYVDRLPAPSRDDPWITTLTGLFGDVGRARAVRARRAPHWEHTATLGAAKELARRALDVHVPAVAFDDADVDAVPSARIARCIEALDDGSLIVELEDDGPELVIETSEIGLVFAGRVPEQAPTPREPPPTPRRPASHYGRGIAGALADSVTEWARSGTGPEAKRALGDRKMVIDLHGGVQMPIRIVEGASRVRGPGFPTAPRQAPEAALVRWLARETTVDQSYDDELRFHSKVQQAPDFDLASARAWRGLGLAEHEGVLPAGTATRAIGG